MADAGAFGSPAGFPIGFQRLFMCLKNGLSFSFQAQRPRAGTAHGALIRWCLRRQHHQEATVGRYKHLTIGEREDIMCMRREGRRVGEIAREIGRDKSTVSRELRRNSCERFYRASTAQRRYEARRERCRRPRLLDDPERLELVRSRVLEGRWSPEQLEGRILLERPDLAVSDTTIYREVAAGRLDRRIGAAGRPPGSGAAAGPARPSRSTGARSSPSTRCSPRPSARSATSACPATPGSAGPTRTPTACCASTSRRAATSAPCRRRRSRWCTMSWTAGRASASDGGRPTRRTTR